MTADQDPVQYLTYRGPAPLVGLLAQELAAEGIIVTYDPPHEDHNAGTYVVVVLLGIPSNRLDDAGRATVRAVVKKIQARFSNVTVEEGDHRQDSGYL
jgi:hypothetical protein